MNKEEFEKFIEQINSSFLSTKQKIGAANSDWKIFSSELQEISERLNSGKSVTKEQLRKVQNIWKSKRPLIDENGNPFVLYIKDHSMARRFNSFRKFHMSWCLTLDSMEKGGRFDRYHKKSDIENKSFHIIYGPKDEEEKELLVCKNCLNLMTTEIQPETLGYTVDNFNALEFFERWGKQKLKEPTRGNFSDTLPSNWTDISLAKRKSVGWICEKCGKNCRDSKGDLHTHHKNGVLGDVRGSNLIALCSECHESEPYHSHMKNLHKNETLIKEDEKIKNDTGSNLQVSKSQRNKFNSFVANPDRYATGSDKTKQKVLEVLQTYESLKKDLNQKEQDDFLEAIKTYKRELKNKL